MNVGEPRNVDFDKCGGLVPAVVQHFATGEVLMLGYMNPEALHVTCTSGFVTFWSRSKQRLWKKGETSGHVLEVKSISVDCDRDALLIRTAPRGPTCHLGHASCFGEGARRPLAFFAELDALIECRRIERPAGSYTGKLFEAGARRIAQKVGEEGVETALAAVAEDASALLGEAADLVYHLMVLLRARGLSLADVDATLARRHARPDRST
jgi:phosphoribosyl-ATP pyrophosphohydrolase/phosphoribosyl-AMP cyclohydrolase